MRKVWNVRIVLVEAKNVMHRVNICLYFVEKKEREQRKYYLCVQNMLDIYAKYVKWTTDMRRVYIYILSGSEIGYFGSCQIHQ